MGSNLSGIYYTVIDIMKCTNLEQNLQQWNYKQNKYESALVE